MLMNLLIYILIVLFVDYYALIDIHALLRLLPKNTLHNTLISKANIEMLNKLFPASVH